MTEEKDSKLFILGIFPKCPFYQPVPLLIILVLIGFGTWGISYLNFWVAFVYLIYSLLFYFLIMPLTVCKYCYFKVKETTIDEGKEKTIEKLLSIEKWSKTHLPLHVGQKNWAFLMFLIWFLPIILIIVSFFIDFSVLAIIALIGFIAVVAGNYLYMVKVKCPKCPIQNDCHSSF